MTLYHLKLKLQQWHTKNFIWSLTISMFVFNVSSSHFTFLQNRTTTNFLHYFYIQIFHHTIVLFLLIPLIILYWCMKCVHLHICMPVYLNNLLFNPCSGITPLQNLLYHYKNVLKDNLPEPPATLSILYISMITCVCVSVCYLCLFSEPKWQMLVLVLNKVKKNNGRKMFVGLYIWVCVCVTDRDKII